MCEQLANIGSEVGRVATAKEQQNHQRFLHAYRRASELLAATIADTRWAGTRRVHELERVRELLDDFSLGSNTYRSSRASFDRYFLPFNYAARADR